MPQQIGFQAVIDLSKFTPAEQAFLKGIQAATAAVQHAAAQSASAASSFDAAASNILRQAQAFDTVGRSAQTMGANIQAGIGIAFGQEIVNFSQNAIRSLEGIIQKGYEVVSFYESLQFSIGSLVANEERRADATLSVADALTIGDVEAQKYLHTLQNLAILSPFNVDTLAAGFKLQQVYGFLADEAMVVTDIITDWGSAANVTNEVMDRVFLAVGQVKSETRLLSREILQLSQAGVPVRQILMDAFGWTADELSENIRKSQVSASMALEPILKWMMEFEGSGERASHTLRGLITSLQDIQEVSERNIFAGIFEPLKPYLQMMVDIGFSDEFRASMVVLGEEIDNLTGPIYAAIAGMLTNLKNWFAALTPEVLKAAGTFVLAGGALTALVAAAGLLGFAIVALVNPFTVLMSVMAGVATAWITNWNDIRSTTESALSDLSQGFAELANAASEWGAAVVEAFASGMSGAVSIVADAMNAIGTMLTFWLQPGSPPRLLPDLDKWGKGAADAYLQGWTLADFEALDAVGSQIEKVLNAWGTAQGKSQKQDVPNIVRNLRPFIAAAVDEFNRLGAISDETFKTMAHAAGFAGEEVGRLLLLQLNYAKSVAAAEAAQLKVNNLTEQYDNQLKELNATLKVYQDQQNKVDTGKEIQRLNRVIASSYTSEAAKAKARAKLGEILTQEKIDQVTLQKDSAVSAAQAELKVAQSVSTELQKQLDIYNQRLNVETRQMTLLEQVEKTQARTAGAARANAKKMMSELEKQLEKIKLQQEEVKDTVALAKARHILEDANSTEIEKQNALLTIQEIILKRQQREEKAKELGIEGIDWEKLRSIPVTLDDIGVKAGKAAGGVNDLGESLLNLKKIDVDKPFADFQKTLAKIRLDFAANIKSFNQWLDSIDAALPSFLKFRSAAYYLDKEIKNGSLSFEQIRQRTQALASPMLQVVPIFKTLSAVFTGLATAFVSSRLLSILASLPALFTTGAGAISLLGLAAGALAIAWQLNLGNIQQHTAELIAYLQTKLAELPAIIATVQDRLAALANLPVFQNILASFRKFGDDLAALWTTLFSDNLTGAALDEALATVNTDLTDFFTVLLEGISLAGDWIRDRFFDTWLPAFTNWVEAVWPRVQIVLSSLLRLWMNWVAAGGVLMGARFVLSWLPAFSSWLGSVWADMSPKLAVLLADINAWIQDSASSLTATFVNVWLPAFTGWIGDIWNTWAPQLLLLLGGLLLWLGGVGATLYTTVQTTWVPALTGWIAWLWRDAQPLLFAYAENFAVWVRDQAATLSTLVIEQWIPAFVDWVANIYAPLAVNLLGLIVTLQAWLVTTGAGIWVTMLNVWVPAFTGWVQDLWSKISPQLATMLASLWAWITANAAVLQQKLVTEWLPAFADWATDIWTQLNTQLSNLLAEISAWIAANAATLTAKFTDEWLPAFSAWAVDLWTQLTAKLDALLTQMLAWIVLTGSTVSTKFQTEWLPAYVNWLQDLWPQYLANLTGFVISMLNWLSTTAPELVAKFQTEWLPAMSNWLAEAVPATLQKLGQWWSAFLLAITAASSTLSTTFSEEWGPAMWEWLTGAVAPALVELASFVGEIVGWLALQGLPLLLAATLDFATALVDWIGDAAIVALPKLGKFMGDIIGWIYSSGVPLLLGGVVKLAEALLGWIDQASALTTGNLSSFMTKIVDWITTTGMPALIKGVIDLGKILVSWIDGDAKGVKQADSAWGKVGESFGKFLAKVKEVITNDIVPGLKEGALNMVKGIMEGIATLWSPENIQAFKDGALDIGASLIAGIEKGIADNFENLKKSFTDSVGGAMDAAKAFLGIKSPSTKAADEIGRPLAEGVNQGVEAVPLDALGKAIAKELVKAMADLELQTPKTMQAIADKSLAILQVFTFNVAFSFAAMSLGVLASLTVWQLGTVTLYRSLSVQVTAIMQALYLNVTAQTVTFTAAVNVLLVAFFAAVIVMLNTFALQATTLITALYLTLDTATRAFAAALLLLWTGIKDSTTSIVVQMKDAVLQAFGAMYTGIEEIVKKIPDLVMKYLGDQKGGLVRTLKDDFVPKGEEIGNAFAEGIADGITEYVGLIEDAATDAMNSAVSAAKTAAKITSPSKRAADELGAPFVQGFARGIAHEADTLTGAAQGLLAQLLGIDVVAAGVKAGQDFAMGFRSVSADLPHATLDFSAALLSGLQNQIASALHAALAALAATTNSQAYALGLSIGAQIAAGISASAQLIATTVGTSMPVAYNNTPVQVTRTYTGAVPAYGAGTINNYNYVRNYNLTLNTERSSASVARDFALMEIVAM